MQKNRLILLALIILAVLILAAVTSISQQKDNQIKIGVTAALTGTASDWGVDEVKAITLAVEEANADGGISGNQIKLIIEDTHTDPKDTLNATIKLIKVNEVKAILGPTWGDSFGEIVGPVGEANKIVQLTPSGALEVAEGTQNFDYFFSTWYPQLPEVQKHIEFANSKGFKKIAIIYDQDPFNTKISQMYKNEAEQNGIEIVSVSEIKVGEKDYRTVLTKIKEARPDAIFISIFETQDLGLLMKTMVELGIESKVLGVASSFTSKLVNEFGDIAQGRIYFSYPDNNLNSYKKFETSFTKRFGALPSGASAGNAYDAARTLIETMHKVHPNYNELKDAL